MKILQTISFGEIYEVKNLFVAFGFRGDDLIPQLITSELNIQPTVAYQKGEEYIGKKYDPKSKKHVEVIRKRGISVWDLDSKSQQHLKRVEEHIEYLLNILEPQAEQIQRYVAQPDKYSISFYIRWEPHGENGSYVVSSDLMRRMEKFCHFFMFSFICYPEEEQ